MIVEPYFSGARCAQAHPTGCLRFTEDWIRRAKNGPRLGPPQRVLVIGSGGGVGLAARVASAFGRGSASIGVSLERPGSPNRPGTAGWYRCLAFERAADRAGLVSRTVIGDAFADTVKQAVAELVAALLGKLDLLVYSIAAPRRFDPRAGKGYTSVIKALGEPVVGLDYDLASDRLVVRTMPVASADEVSQTVKVMGGEDFTWWVELLRARRLLAPGVRCLTLSYVGVPQLARTYRHGSLGRAKDDLEACARQVNAELRAAELGCAETAVLRALVTQASTAIPLNTLYTMLLLRVLTERSVVEDPLDQANRLVTEELSGRLDEAGRRRLDEAEQSAEVQAEIWRRWRLLSDKSVAELAGVDDYRRQVHQLYGFDVPAVDYRAEVEPRQGSTRLVAA
ncbi:MAG TPA: hypothetical protein VJ851_09530 [Jatrophihabitans sp.]|nr:hypothetical protein [Jatrophihabitans sp.]